MSDWGAAVVHYLAAGPGLRAAGVRITLEDFGSGYCSLGLLAQLPLDMVKIERSVIAAVDTDPRARALATSIIGLASALGLITIAEGAERAEQLAVLRMLGCQQWQGYLYAAPVPAEELEKLLHGTNLSLAIK